MKDEEKGALTQFTIPIVIFLRFLIQILNPILQLGVDEMECMNGFIPSEQISLYRRSHTSP